MSDNHMGVDEPDRTVVSPEELQVGKKYYYDSSDDMPTSGFGDLEVIGTQNGEYRVGVNNNWFVILRISDLNDWWSPKFVARMNQIHVSHAKDIQNNHEHSFAGWMEEAGSEFADFLVYSNPDVEEVSRVSAAEVEMVVYDRGHGSRAKVTLTK